VGTLPVEGKEKEEVKRTNEIKTAIPLLETIDMEGKDLTADALLTQRELATYLVATGTMMRTAVASGPAMARKTSSGFVVSPSVCSNPKAEEVWRRRCDV
jgi:predicted transposase YbfD/YdcC